MIVLFDLFHTFLNENLIKLKYQHFQYLIEDFLFYQYKYLLDRLTNMFVFRLFPLNLKKKFFFFLNNLHFNRFSRSYLKIF